MEKDLRQKGFLCDPERFADLVNGVVCAGKEVLSAEKLSEVDSQTGFSRPLAEERQRGPGRKQRYRDLVRKAAFGIHFMIIGIENQEEVHYLMPLRSMAYDVAEYERQAAEIRRQVRRRKDISSAEFLSGFTRENRLNPCVTLVLYYGEEWDGARELHGILDFAEIPQELKDMVNNYKIYVCEVRKFENTEVFQTDVKQVFDCIRYSEDPEKLYELIQNDPAYQELEEETYDVIAEHIKTVELMKVKQYKKEGGKVDMCGAIAELIQRGRLEGMNQGIEQGIEQGIRALIDTSIEFGSSREETLDRLMEKLKLSREAAGGYMERYWHG